MGLLKKYFKIIFLLSFFSSIILYSQSKQEIVYKVNILGNKRIEKDAIYPYISIRPGDVFDINKIREDVKSIYKMGYFENVLVNYHKLKQGIEITFIVVEKPYIGFINFKGIKQLKKSKITKELKVKPFTVLNEELLKKDIQKIIDIYQENGFYSVKVKYKISKPRHNRVTIDIIINEGIKSKVKKVKFVGNKHIKASKIQKHIFTRPYNFLLSWITGTGYLKKSELEKDVKRIENLYFSEGYVRAKVFDPIVKVLKGGKYLTVTFKIEEGKRYKFSTIEILDDNLTDELRKKFMENLECKKGDYFSNKKIHDDIQYLTDAYGDLGYAFADINPITRINDDNLTVSVAFKVERGNLFKFREIHISGNTYTRDKVIRRNLRIYEQDKYTISGLKRSRALLKRTGFFSEVDITTKKISNNEIDAFVKVKEQQTGSFTIGGGYSSSDNFIFTGSLSKNNLFGKGYNASFYVNFSSDYSRYNILFEDPAFLDSKISTGYNLYSIDTEYDSYDTLSKGFSINFGAPFNDFSGWKLGYFWEKVKVYNVDIDAAQYIKDEEGTRSSGGIIFTLSKNTTDDYYYPTKGVIQSFKTTITSSIFGGDESFYKLVGESRWFKRIKGKMVFSFHLKLGYIDSFGGDEIPSWEKFYVGGLKTIRGFKFGKAGPRDEVGDVKGADKEIITNTEIRFPILEELGVRGVLFFDMGKGYDEGEFDLDLRKSTGAGISWRSPFGPVVVYWGLNLSPKEDEKRSVFHFSMGKTF